MLFYHYSNNNVSYAFFWSLRALAWQSCSYAKRLLLEHSLILAGECSIVMTNKLIPYIPYTFYFLYSPYSFIRVFRVFRGNLFVLDASLVGMQLVVAFFFLQ